MDLIERDKKLNQLKYIIDKKKSGSSVEIANRLEVSRATLFRLINHLKIREGREIKYCKLNHYFFFETDED